MLRRKPDKAPARFLWGSSSKLLLNSVCQVGIRVYYCPVTFDAFKLRVNELQAQGKTLFVSSSFQTHSIPLLHMISRVDQKIPVVFLNTGFLFADTLRYRDQVIEMLGLSLIDVRSEVPKIHQRDANGNFYFTSDPDRCCYLNKVQPMQPLMRSYDYWISGVRGDQSNVRQSMSTEQEAEFGCTRFHPMLDWSSKMIWEYRKQFNLPAHPMEAKGYFSIGCEPCTMKFDPENRDGRWFGMHKTECGLHTELAGSKNKA